MGENFEARILVLDPLEVQKAYRRNVDAVWQGSIIALLWNQMEK
jgi:hypothetical protein